jgi:predicted transposase YbfD/YdcC
VEGYEMNKLLSMLEIEEPKDPRQPWKVKHLIGDVIAIVFFATLAKCDDWVEIEDLAKYHEKTLRRYLELPNGIPSHDTIQRVIAMISPTYIQELRDRWNEMVTEGTDGKVRKLLGIDGKTQRGNASDKGKANHIVSAVDDRGFCVGEVKTHEKSNEITAIPILLQGLNIKDSIITTDAMGCQKDIVKIIRRKKADYVLAVKGNQGTLHEDIKLYFEDTELLAGCAYKKTFEKARGNKEIREYWQTDDISWLSGKKDWTGLKTIAMTKNTITKKEGSITIETRYFISSLPLKVDDIAWAIRKHWMVESYHWILDVVFREDANRTLEETAAYNLNIFRKMALNTLKLMEFPEIRTKNVSIKSKRNFMLWGFDKYIEKLMTI